MIRFIHQPVSHCFEIFNWSGRLWEANEDWLFPLWHKMLLWVELRIPFAVVILQNHHNHCQLSVLLQSLFLPLLTHYWQRRRRRGVGEDRMQRSECNKKAWQGLLDQIAFNKTVANLQICHQHNHQNSLSQHPSVPAIESSYKKEEKTGKTSFAKVISSTTCWLKLSLLQHRHLWRQFCHGFNWAPHEKRTILQSHSMWV